MVRKQEKSDLTGLIKWKFQKVTFFLLTLYKLHLELKLGCDNDSMLNSP